MTKTVFISAGTTSWVVPQDFSAINAIHCLGGGGGGGALGQGGCGATYASREGVVLQPGDVVMDADFGSDGLMVRTGAGVYAVRSLSNGTGIAITNADGDSGNPTIALTTTAQASLALADSALQISAIGSTVQAHNSTLTALTSASSNGISLVTAANYAAMRGLLDLEPGTNFYSLSATDSLLSGKVGTGRQLASGNGLTGGGDLSADRTLAVGAGIGITVNADDVAVDKASDANVRSATSNKVLTTDLVESASALVSLTSTSNATAVNWDAGINFTLTTSENTTISNPSNGQPGTWRTILVQGNDATDRTITFGTNFEGEVPTITDADNGRWYLLTIYCVTSSHFVVSSKKANGT